MAIILDYFTNSVAFVANYIKVVISHQQIFSQEMSPSTPTKHDGRAVLFVIAELSYR